jgi:fatty acid desaturase
MKTAVRVSLACAALFEIIVTLAIVLTNPNTNTDPPDTAVAVAPPANWAFPMGLLAILTIGAFFVFGWQWPRMAHFEKLLLIVPAVAPLVLLRFLFSAAAVLIVGCLAVVVVVAVLAIAGGGMGGLGHSGGTTHQRSEADVYDGYGNRLGSVNRESGDVHDRYGNRIGSVD